jgi:ankyrin repeat protein
MKGTGSRTALHNAINQKDDAMIAILLDSRGIDLSVQDHNGDTPLHRAAYYGSEAIALRLLESGVGVSTENLAGSIALHAAAASGLVNVVRRMLERETLDPNHQNKKGITPLHLAFKHNQHYVARILLNSGKVDPNKEDFWGRMPLEYSALRLSTPIIRLLFDSEEIRPMAKDLRLDWTGWDGQNLLQRVIACRPKPETLDLLLTISNFDAAYTDNEGRTALHSAVVYGAGFQLLLDTENFDHALRWKDQNGLTPQDLAEKMGNQKAIRALTTGNSAVRAYERLGPRKRSS